MTDSKFLAQAIAIAAGLCTGVHVGRANVLTPKESIGLNRALGVRHSPELKGATHPDRLDTIFGGQRHYAQKLIDSLRGAAKGGWYYQFDSSGTAIAKESDMHEALDVLARRVKILGIFSDWPATVTYYANCMGLR